MPFWQVQDLRDLSSQYSFITADMRIHTNQRHTICITRVSHEIIDGSVWHIQHLSPLIVLNPMGKLYWSPSTKSLINFSAYGLLIKTGP